MSSSKLPDGYLISTDQEKLTDFNRKVLVQNLWVLHDMKEQSDKISGAFTVIFNSVEPLHEFIQMLLEKKAPAKETVMPQGIFNLHEK